MVYESWGTQEKEILKDQKIKNRWRRFLRQDHYTQEDTLTLTSVNSHNLVSDVIRKNPEQKKNIKGLENTRRNKENIFKLTYEPTFQDELFAVINEGSYSSLQEKLALTRENLQKGLRMNNLAVKNSKKNVKYNRKIIIHSIKNTKEQTE